MKRLLAFALGLLLTLGLASAASADFAIGGQFEVEAYYQGGDYGFYTDSFDHFNYFDTWVGLKAAGEFGRATGEINLQLRGGPLGNSINGEFMYGLSDTVGIGVAFGEMLGVVFYESPIWNDFEDRNWAIYYGEYAKAAVSLGDFDAEVLANFASQDGYDDYQVIADLEYGADRLALYLPLMLGHDEYSTDEESTWLYAALAGRYAISDALSVAAELYYYDYEHKDAGAVAGENSQTILSLGAEYATDGWAAKGFYSYDIEAEETDSYGAGLDLFLDKDVTLGFKYIDYTTSGGEFSVSLTVGFGDRDFPPVGGGPS